MGSPVPAWLLLDEEPLPEIGHHGGCCLALWAMVMHLAIVDLRHAQRHQSTLRWFLSADVREGSFYWICSVLDFDADRVRKVVLERFGRPGARGRRVTMGRRANQYEERAP